MRALLLGSLVSWPLAAGEPLTPGEPGSARPEPRRYPTAPEVVGHVAAAPLVPWMSRGLLPPIRRKLVSAFALAEDRLRERPSCRELFTERGAVGQDILATQLYYEASVAQELSLCHGAVAFCRPGARVVRLCRSFAALPEKRAALVVLHEALHSAGMTESPADPTAPDAWYTTRMVRKSCGW